MSGNRPEANGLKTCLRRTLLGPHRPTRSSPPQPIVAAGTRLAAAPRDLEPFFRFLGESCERCASLEDVHSPSLTIGRCSITAVCSSAGSQAGFETTAPARGRGHAAAQPARQALGTDHGCPHEFTSCRFGLHNRLFIAVSHCYPCSSPYLLPPDMRSLHPGSLVLAGT